MTGIAMPKTRYLQRRGSRYYLRMRVPNDVKKAFGREMIFERLPVSDWREARTEINRRLAGYEDQFERLRGNGVRSERNLTWEDVDRIVSAWLNQQLQLIALTPPELVVDGVLSFGDIDNDMQRTARLLTQLQMGGGEEADQHVEDQMHALLLDDGFPALSAQMKGSIQPSTHSRADINHFTPEFTYLRRQVHAGLEAISKATLLKYRGQSTIDAALLPMEVRQISNKSVCVGQILREFRDEKRLQKYGARKLLSYNVVAAIMHEVFGADKHLDKITTTDCRRLIQVLRTIPTNAKKRFPNLTYSEAATMAVEKDVEARASATIASDIHAASAVFNWAVDQGYLEKNPMPRRTMPRSQNSRADEQRDAFKNGDLQAIYATPLFSGSVGASRGSMRRTHARQWIPILSLYHGCRLNELCQLYVDDIRINDQTPHIAIQDNRPDQRLKTPWSRRNIPIHPKVIEIGFVDFVEQMRAAGEERLFPELKLCSRGYYSASYQKWFSRFLVDAGVKKEKISFHSFRHSFRNATREARLSVGTVCVLGGWKLESIHDRYGNYELAMLANEISKISYGITLQRIS